MKVICYHIQFESTIRINDSEPIIQIKHLYFYTQYTVLE